MRLRFQLLNVFARQDDPFSGNPLCVFEDGEALSEEQMQGIARQFNLSETAFIQPPQDGAEVGVRIFTPNYEMAFAGHPTLGTAHVARALGLAADTVHLSMPAGVVPVSAQGHEWTLTATPGRVLADYDPADIARAVGLDAADLAPPVQQVSTGSPQVIAQVRSSEALARAVGDAALMRRFAGMGTRGGETLVYLWHDRGDGHLEARGLFTQATAAIEDPATGSACANLGAWLASQGRAGTWTVSQGAHLRRPSTLRLEVGRDGTVRVGGLVHEVGGGEVVV
jgi:trans-2,3-dihydro-3-hydroxyanthranilate isomerase